MSAFYTAAYWLGLTPWEQAATRPARERVRRAGVPVEFIRADVTALRHAGVGPGVRLFRHFGTIHGFDRAQRQGVAREIAAPAADDAALLILAWAPGRRGPLPRGASRSDLEEGFAGWRVTDEAPVDVTGLPPPRRRVASHVDRFRRT